MTDWLIARGSVTGRAIIDRTPTHVHDLQAAADEFPDGSKTALRLGFRTNLAVPLLRQGDPIGVLAIRRNEVKPFTDKQIELVATFADQAVIAIENARLLEELHERQAELRVTFDNMGDGVVMFDAAGRLIAWNRNFQELIELPEAFLAGRPTRAEYF